MKFKINKSINKRIRKSKKKNKMIKYKKSFLRHLLTKKNAKSKRKLREKQKICLLTTKCTFLKKYFYL